MKKARTKKYPIFTYLCYLLVVSLLFTGVTFSRYSITTSGGASTGVAAFNCSYTIDNFSSFNFNNANYWLNNNMAVGVSRTVRYTLRNSNENGTSGVDLDGHIRLYLPAELADNFAMQIETDRAPDESTDIYTPQFVLKDIISSAGSTDGTYIAGQNDYGALGSVNNEKWDVTGGFTDNSDTISVSYIGVVDNEGKVIEGAIGSGIQMTITKHVEKISYSLGFKRSGNDDAILSPLYLDLTKEEAYYLIDIFLPTMEFSGGNSEEGQYVIYYTLTHSIQNSASWVSDPSSTTVTVPNIYLVDKNSNVYSDSDKITDLDKLITDPPQSGKEYVIVNNGQRIVINGYHYDQNTTQEISSTSETGTTTITSDTTVRVKCEYNYAGGYKISLYHVERIKEGDGLFVHPLEINGEKDLTNVSYSDIDQGVFANLTGECTEGALEGGKTTVNISALTADPLYAESGQTVTISEAMSRSYYFRMTALFVQTSETGSAGGEA